MPHAAPHTLVTPSFHHRILFFLLLFGFFFLFFFCSFLFGPMKPTFFDKWTFEWRKFLSQTRATLQDTNLHVATAQKSAKKSPGQSRCANAHADQFTAFTEATGTNTAPWLDWECCIAA